MFVEAEELDRRLVHLAGTGYPLLYLLDRQLEWNIVGWTELQLIVIASAAGALILEVLRLRGMLELWFYDALTRDYEQEYIAGYALYLIGIAFTVVLFTPAVALPAVLMLTIGDPISGLLSSGNLAKSTRVLFAMFGICLLLAAPFVPPAVAVVGAVTATAADGLKPVVFDYVIDDNLTIPIGAGATMTGMLALL